MVQPALQVVVEATRPPYSPMPITVAPGLGQRPGELPLVGREERLDEDDVHVWHGNRRVAYACHGDAGFVAPYLLDTTTRFVEAAAPAARSAQLALITCEPADRLPPELKRAPGRALADRRPARPRPDRRRGPGPVRPARPGRAAAGRPGAAAGAAGPGPRAPRHRRHGRGHGRQLPGQGADEDGAAGGGRAVRPAPAGRSAPRRGRLRRAGGFPAGGQAARRRGREEHLPPRRSPATWTPGWNGAALAGAARRRSRSSSPATRAPTTA